MKKKKLFLMVAIFLLALPSVFSIPFFNNSFTIRQEYNLTANYTISDTRFTNLTNFTAYLSFDTQTLISQGKLKSDCSDLRVVDANTNEELNFEIEQGTCNQALGTPLFIRLPLLKHENTGVVNNIHIYYNSTEATFKPVVFSQETWDRRYKLIWHVGNASVVNSVNGQVSGGIVPNHQSPNSELAVGNMLNVTLGTQRVDISNFPRDNVTNVTIEALYSQHKGNAGSNDEFLVLGGAGSARQNGIGGQLAVSTVGNKKIYSTIDFNSINRPETSGHSFGIALYSVGNWIQNAIGANEAISQYYFNGDLVITGTSSTRWDLTDGASNSININHQTVFGAGSRAFRGMVTEVRIANNFTQASSSEQIQQNSNLFLENDDFWIQGNEEFLIDDAPEISLTISNPTPETGEEITITADCTDDFGLLNIIVENDLTGVFVQVNSGALSGLSDSFVHPHTATGESKVTVTHRITCTDNNGQSSTETISYSTLFVLPLQSAVELVGMIVLFLIILSFIFKTTKRK